MENEAICALRVFLPGVNEFPIEQARHWAESYYRVIKSTGKSLLKSIPDAATFRRKLGRPVIRLIDEYINPDFVTRSGRDKQAIMDKLIARFHDRKTARKYFNNVKRAYRTVKGIPAKRIKDSLSFSAAEYALKMTFGAWRFLGPIQGQGRGAFALAEAYLCGQLKASSLARPQDEITINQSVCLTTPARVNEFRMKLHNQLMHSAANIIDRRYADRVIRAENDAINRLINKFARKEFVPFSSGGSSHIDFVVHPDSIVPDDSLEIADIKYRIYESFLGQKMADHLKSRCQITHRVTKVRPEEYLGRSNKLFYADMHLDVQVMKK
ncbi:MAG: hypothetical protein AAB038_05800 [Planctomycetota bacterium]|mgnify:FL=1